MRLDSLQGRLLRPYSRLSTLFQFFVIGAGIETTKPGGTGLGLYIVREIVAAHEGQGTVQSAEGRGTTFTITLPRTPEEAMPQPAGSQA